ncbi:hypothetical protein [Mesorhizobium sp. ES1-6]|nr:hypothetical protein [Mesorhizobium sp. ES1-6]MBZ9741521.1 hypothetical protein [Mesorhizobium sp. CO1-1-4]MBZ9805196.1 hypothetical protein [Mesorhizobium sp. ES1-6]
MAAHGNPLAVMADCDAVGYVEAVAEQWLVPDRPVAQPADSHVPGHQMRIIVAHQQADAAAGLAPGNHRSGCPEFAERLAVDPPQRGDFPMLARHAFNGQGKYRKLSIAVGDHQGPVIDEVEAMDLAYAVRP